MYYIDKGYSKAADKLYHIFIKDGWYIKFILLDGIVNIISVHKDEYHVYLLRGCKKRLIMCYL